MSDLHCHASTVAPAETLLLTDGLRVPVNQHPIGALLKLIEDSNGEIQADVLLVAGDWVNKISKQGMCSVWPMVKEVATKLGASLVSGTIGNHDVDSRRLHEEFSNPFHIAKTAHGDFPILSLEEREQFWNVGYCVLGHKDLRILIVNSVHDDEHNVDHGGIATEVINRIKEDLEGSDHKQFQVAIMHHHPHLHEDHYLGTYDVMENGSLLLQLLEDNKFDLVIHGHKHYPKISYAAGSRESVSVMAAGSFSASLSGHVATITRNLFHIIEMDDKEIIDCGKHGIIKSWQFSSDDGWVKSMATAAGISHESGYGCRMLPKKLAEDMIQQYASRSDGQILMPWAEMLAKVPILRYMTPGQQQALSLELKTLNYQTEPELPKCPVVFGAMQGGD
jgi:predicted phosphodiesterase